MSSLAVDATGPNAWSSSTVESTAAPEAAADPVDCGEVCLVAPHHVIALVPCGYARFLVKIFAKRVAAAQ